jgi:hypothetical protein
MLLPFEYVLHLPADVQQRFADFLDGYRRGQASAPAAYQCTDQNERKMLEDVRAYFYRPSSEF